MVGCNWGVVCLDFVWLDCPGSKASGSIHLVRREIVWPELSQNHHSDLWDFSSAAVAHDRTQVRVAFWCTSKYSPALHKSIEHNYRTFQKAITTCKRRSHSVNPKSSGKAVEWLPFAMNSAYGVISRASLSSAWRPVCCKRMCP